MSNTKNLKAFRQTLKDRLRQLRDDKSGVSAIEFAIIAMVLVWTYIGLYEVSLAYEANGAVNNASDVAASFPTFYDDLTPDDLSEIMTASVAVVNFSGVDKDRLTVRLFSIESNGGNLSIIGDAIYEGNLNNEPTQINSTYLNNLNISLADGQGLIIAESSYAYNPCLLYTSPSPRDQRGSRMPSSA